MSQALKARGCAAIHVSSGGVSPQQSIKLGPGYQVPYAQRVKADVGLPTIAVSLVSEGRRRELARFPEFANPATRERIPDPQAEPTYRRSVLDWNHAGAAIHKDWLGFHQALLALRARAVAPLLVDEPVPGGSWKAHGDTALEVAWTFPAGTLRLVANLGAAAVPHEGPRADWGRRLYALALPAPTWSTLPPWSVAFYLASARP